MFRNFRTSGYLRMLLFFLLCLPSYALSNYNLQYKQIGIEEGLSEAFVSAILRDSRGLLWIGTHSGLNRYEKFNIQIFLKEQDNPASLPGNRIHMLAEDSNANLWIGTNNGLAVYDFSLDRFTLRSKDLIFSALNIGDDLLFGGTKCIYHYNVARDLLTRIPIDFPDEKGKTYSIQKIQRNAAGEIILGATHGKLYRFNPENNSFIRDIEVPVSFLFSMCCGSDGYYYISPYKAGLIRFDAQGNQITHWTIKNSSLSNDIITDIQELEKGKLWMTTDGGGICIFDMNDCSFSTIRHVQGDPNSLPTNSLSLLYKDCDDNLWAGTIKNGLLNIRSTFIKTFQDAITVNAQKSYGLSDKVVISHFEDTDGIVWIGTDGGGVNAYNPRTGTFKHFSTTYGQSITSITDFDKKNLLISIFNKGAFFFSKHDGSLTPFIIKGNTISGYGKFSGFTPSIYRVAPDKIYILSDVNYIYRLSTSSFSYMKVIPGEQVPTALNLSYIGDSISYGISENKIYEIKQQNDELRLLITLEDDENITSLCCEDPDRFWIGSNWGLSFYDRSSHRLVRVPTKLFNTVSHMVSDGSDRLWICADNHLFSYDISSDKFAIWGESDGFLPNEIIKTFQNPPRGRYIYLGGVNGLAVIDRTLTPVQNDNIVIRLREVMLNGKSYIPVNGKNRFRIPHDYSSFSISAYTQEKDIFRKVLYRYIIRGGISVQELETEDRSLNLPMLPPGNYIISVSCNRKNGTWSDEQAIAYIDVIPPWYRSRWAILLFLLLLILCFIVIIRFIHRRNEAKFRWQLKEYEQKINEKKIQFLVNISHELRTPLTLIYAPLRRLLKGLGDDDPAKESLTDIYHQACYMKDVINMVLDINKLDQGGFGISPTCRPFNPWLGKLVNSFAKEFAENGVDLVFIPDEQVDVVSFDDTKLRIVVSNLLVNSLKFSPSGTKVQVCTQRCGSMVRVRIADQGIGLRHVDTTRLFSRFYQGDHNQKGNGIGLAYSRQLIELHGGTIQALDNEGGGAVFQFEIPAADSRTAGNMQVLQPVNPLAVRNEEVSFNETNLKEFCSSYSILIVEDNTEFRCFIRNALKDYFKNVYSAEDGERGLELTRSKRPDIVVSDVMMPVMNGFQLCRHIKEDIVVSHSMVILLTAVGDSASVSLGYKLGADFYLAKPFEIDMLLILIYNQLKTRERIRKLYMESANILSPVEATTSSADESFLIKLNKLISEHMNDRSFNIDFLVDHMGVGRTTFYQKVKILTDMSVNDYINKIRIGQAAVLLETTDATVSEIADKVGYAYQCHFSTSFKQIIGMTPTEYRRSKKKSTKESEQDS